MKVTDKRNSPQAIRFEELPVGQCFIDPKHPNELCLKCRDIFKDDLNTWSFTENDVIYFWKDEMVVPVDVEIHIVK